MTEVAFDWEDLTMEEIEFLEEYTGTALDEMQSAGSPKGKLLTAIAYIAMKRQDPEFTIEQARQLKIKEATGALDALGGPNPPPAA